MKLLKAGIIAATAITAGMGLTACGSGNEQSTQPATEQTVTEAAPTEQTTQATSDVKGSQQTSGNISVFVPEGYTLSMGDITGIDDGTDANKCYMQSQAATLFDYYSISVKDSEDSAKLEVEMTKDINDAQDCTVKAGDTEWKGCKYIYNSATEGDVECSYMYATINNKVYVASCCGHSTESPELITVLGSVKSAN